MTNIDLDLQAVEDQMDGEGTGRRIELGVLDGTTSAQEWLAAVESGAVLVLAVEGDVNERASGFAREIRDAGGELMHFRDFLIVSPPGVVIDTDRL